MNWIHIADVTAVAVSLACWGLTIRSIRQTRRYSERTAALWAETERLRAQRLELAATGARLKMDG